MEIIHLVIGFFAGIGIMLCILWIIIPLCDSLLYGLGYTIFNILCTNRKKALSKPHRYVITVIKWYIIGVTERFCGYGTTEKITYGKKEWSPYFHYNKFFRD